MNSGSFNTTGYQGRYLTFSWNISYQNITANTTTIEWKLAGAGNATSSYYKSGNFKVVIDGKIVYSNTNRINLYNGTLVASGTYTFNHNQSGERSFSASAEAGIYTFDVNCSGNGTFTLDTIPRAATILSVSGDKISDIFWVKYQKYISTYTCNLKIAVSGYSAAQTITGYQNATGFSFYDVLKKEIYRTSANSASANVDFWLETYDGSTLIGVSDTITKSIAVSDSAPTIGGISYKDLNVTTISITGSNQKLIRNHSVLSATVSNIEAKNGATLSSLRYQIGGIDQTLSLTGSSYTEQTLTLGSVDLAGDAVLTATVTDSRGNTAVSSINVNILDYEKPTALITCKRRENFYTETELTVNPVYSDLDGGNEVTITAYSKEKTAESYGTGTVVPSGKTSILSLDNTKAWDIKVVVADRLNSTTYVLYVEKGQPIIFFDRNKYSVGVNCFPKDSESFEVLGKNIYKSLYYLKGDTISVSNVHVGGFSTGQNTELHFSVFLPKSLEDISAITVNEMKLNVRHTSSDGYGYTLTTGWVDGGYDILSDSTITVTYDFKTGINAVSFSLKKSSAYRGSNNYPQSVEIVSLKLGLS